MGRYLRSQGIDTRYLTPLDRLAYMGQSAGLKQVSMQRVIERVTESISRWGEWCKQAGMTSMTKFPPDM
ncbi:hypothetical protein MNBD_GAMMA11-2932 [hydrothermal vent metagenome]|uniref:Uncharacterized protein n=1 Tax=hydrothermal vent metagenome TaxID=652676 RepID=A0A3B0X6M1_9ZZZZ